MNGPAAAQDVFREAGLTVFERGWLSSNCVLFADPQRGPAVLIDSGYASHQEQTLALVRAALGGRRLERIVNTHLHSDHCGGNALLQQTYGCAIDVPVGERAKVDTWDEALLSFRDTGQQCPRFHCSGVLLPEQTIVLGGRKWRVIAAPGHDPESIVLYEPELRVLISADALWQNGFGVVFPEIEGVGAFDVVRTTLKRIAELPIDWVIPGHGAPFSDVPGALDRALTRLDSFVAAPARHTRHAAKVLIKFHLLEVRVKARPELMAWMQATRYMRLLHALDTAGVAFETWAGMLIDDLIRSGALRIENDRIFDA